MCMLQGIYPENAYRRGLILVGDLVPRRARVCGQGALGSLVLRGISDASLGKRRAA